MRTLGIKLRIGPIIIAQSIITYMERVVISRITMYSHQELLMFGFESVKTP